jgi:methylmalonyl-CoA mutase cobalamin-binding subunit
MVCGVISPHDFDYLRDVGVQGIYGLGSNGVECAAFSGAQYAANWGVMI